MLCSTSFPIWHRIPPQLLCVHPAPVVYLLPLCRPLLANTPNCVTLQKSGWSHSKKQYNKCILHGQKQHKCVSTEPGATMYIHIDYPMLTYVHSWWYISDHVAAIEVFISRSNGKSTLCRVVDTYGPTLQKPVRTHHSLIVFMLSYSRWQYNVNVSFLENPGSTERSLPLYGKERLYCATVRRTIRE